MSKIAVSFAWPVAEGGYELRAYKQGKTIQPKDKNCLVSTQNPISENPYLFMEFANLGDKPETYVSFANRFGLLEKSAPDESEAVAVWRDETRKMREAIKQYRDHKAHPEKPTPLIPTISVRADLRAKFTAEGGAPGLAFQLTPNSFKAALWLQFANYAGSGGSIRECQECGGWFTAGAGGKRIVARFCSDVCRTNFHNKAKKKARNK